jgi:hypothetical protein
MSVAMRAGFGFAIQGRDGAARSGKLTTPHGDVPTPAFMPVATYGAVRGIEAATLRAIGARILLIADDYDVLESRKLTIAARLRVMESRLGQYDPTLLAALRLALRNVPDTATGDESVVVRLERVRVGMIFAEDVIGPNDLTLIGRGQEVTPALVERLRLLAAPIRESQVRMFPGRTD